MRSLFGNEFRSMPCTFNSCLAPITMMRYLFYASCRKNNTKRPRDNIMHLVTLKIPIHISQGNFREPQET